MAECRDCEEYLDLQIRHEELKLEFEEYKSK